MNIQSLLENVKYLNLVGQLRGDVLSLEMDSRKVQEGGMYIALKGSEVDGHIYIDSAIGNGAKFVVCEDLPQITQEDILYIVVKDSKAALGEIASNFYGKPSEKLTLVGVTGTNGKTSVATILYDLYEALGYSCALLSTVENRIRGEKMVATHTTPDNISINKFLSQALNEGSTHVFMEVSSHGLDQGRIQGLKFDVAGFTNLTHDHLDYHQTFANYLKAKKGFFDNLNSNAVAITNIDDKNGMVMLQNTAAKKVTYGLKTLADYQGKILEVDFSGMLLRYNGKEFWTRLSGKFNAYNLLLAFAIATELGEDADEILKVLSNLERVSGRFQTIISPSGIVCVVDYAHTPDALENTLDSINEIRTKNERLITVFGCGGDRDRTKRPEMGKISTRKSTLSIFTSDNPRFEDPEKIIEDIEKGVEAENFNKYTSIPDRKSAIKMAIKFAEPKDIILVAGKGHESYQEIKGERFDFSDTKTLEELFNLMGK